MASPYAPWRYADRRLLRQQQAAQFRERARQREERTRAIEQAQAPSPQPQPQSAPKKGGGGWLDKLGGVVDAVTPDALEAPAKAAFSGTMTALDAPGRATRGIIHKTTGLDLNRFVDDPNQNAFLRTLVGGATDPLSYIGPGAVKAGLRFAPAAVQGMKGAKWAAAALEAPLPASVGGILGAATGAQVADNLGIEGAGALPFQLGGGLAGGFAGARYALRGPGQLPRDLAAMQGRPGQIPAAGLGLDIVDDIPPAELGRFKHAEITERPDLFQARTADPGKSFSQARVDEILAQFDPKQLEQGSLVRDTSTGDLVVFSGHHRLQVMKAKAAEGVFPDVQNWEVYSADLSNPAHVAELQRLADYKNYGVATTTLEENVRVYRRAKARGEEKDAILDKMRAVDKTQRHYLDALADLPDDLIERASQAGRVDNAGEIALAARTYNLDEREVRAIFGRYGPGGPQQGITPGALKRRLEEAGRALSEARAKKMQGGFGDLGEGFGDWDDTISEVLTRIDEIDTLEHDLNLQIKRLNALDKGLSEFADDPEIATEASAVRSRVDERRKQLQEQLDAARAGYEARKRADWERSAGGGVSPRDVEDPPAPEAAGPLPGQSGLFGDAEPETVKRVDLEGNVTDTFQTEGELNGFRQTQGALPDTATREMPPPPVEATAPTAEFPRPAPSAPPAATMPSPAPANRSVPPSSAGSVQPPLSPGMAPRSARPQGPSQPGLPGLPQPPSPPQPPLPNRGRPTPPRQGGTDMFRTETPYAVRAREARYLQSVKGKIDQGARKAAAKAGGERLDANLVKDVDVRPFVVAERNRLQNMISDYEGLADVLFTRAEKAGITWNVDPDGRITMPNGATFEDMMEGITPEGQAAWAALTPDQQRTLDNLRDFNMQLNDNLTFHGKGMQFADPEIERAYFPRIAVGKDGVEKAYVGETGRAPMGSGGSFLRDRIHDSLEDGLAAKINYADPRQAYRQMVRAKLRVAGDAYVMNAVKPLGMTAAQIKAQNLNAFNYVELPPTIAPGLQGTFFPREVAERIVAELKPQNPPGYVKAVQEVNRTLTPFRAVGDISWFGQQGAPMLFRHPLRAAKGAIAVLKSVSDDAEYLKLIDQEAARGPGIQELISRNLHWVPDDIGEIGLGFRKSGIPGYKQVAEFSNKTFGRYMNYVRLVFANDAYERAMKSGLTGANLDKELRGAMNAVNRMSGFSGRKPTSLESITAFAPRYLSASVEQVAAAVSKGGLEGSLARAHVARMLGFGALMVAGINKLRGYDTDFDPRSPNFLRLRNVGGLDVSLFGTYDTLFRAIAGTAAGESGEPLKPDVKRLWRFAEGKMSPGLKLIYEPFIKGSTYTGEPLDPLGSWEGLGKAIWYEAKSSVPFGAQALIEEGIEPAIEQRSLRPLAESTPGLVTSAAGFTNAPVTPTEHRNWSREDVAQERFGRSYDDLLGAEKAQVNQDERVARRQEEADRNTLTREDDRSRYLEATLGAAAKIDVLSTELEAGNITGNEWRRQYQALQAELRGARGALKIDGRSDKTVDGWFALYDEAEGEDGRLDYDLLESLQAEYRAQHPDVDEKVAKITGTQDNATVREYREAQKLASAYYAMSAYRGLTPEESQRASQILAAAQDMVSFGLARNMDRAFRELSREDPEGVKLARRAQRRGPNRERQRFRRENPLMAKFYSDI